MDFHFFVLIFFGIVSQLEAKWKEPWVESVKKTWTKKQRQFDRDVPPFDQYKDWGFHTVVYVGTPPDWHLLNIRINHQNMWLTDPSFSGYSEGNFYDPRNSSTSIITGKNSTEFYGKAKLSGRQIIDKIWIKPKSFPMENSFNQTFTNLVQLTTESYDDLVAMFDDGIIGYGWNSSEDTRILTENSPPILHILDGLENRTVTFWQFRHSYHNATIGEQIISYGKHLHFDKCHPYIHSIPFNKGEMTFFVDRFQLGQYDMKRKQKTWIDTHDFYIALPSTLFRYIKKTLNPIYNEESHIYEVDCSLKHTLPDVFFTINEEQFGVHPMEYVSDDWLPNNMCALLFAENTDPNIDIALGTPFMRSWCTTIDVDNNLLGLSAAFHTH